jgi:hypothetical protein
MFGTDWQTSAPEYDVTVEREVRIPLADGIYLSGDVFRPESDDPVPLLVGFHPYNNEFQSAQIRPNNVCPQVAWIEGGDPRFFARRGYAHAFVNVRGTGGSAGRFRNMDAREVEDAITAIHWFADRTWCDGTVGLFGLAYFGALSKRIAVSNPDPVDAIFAPWSYTDPYRDLFYHGGILAHEFLLEFRDHLDNPRCQGWSRERFAPDVFEEKVAEAMADEEIAEQEAVVDALDAPTEGTNPLVVDVVLNGINGEGAYFEERTLNYDDTSIPAYLGADWGHHTGHLSAAFRSWDEWDGATKLLVGPDRYLDRPYYQLHHEALRWFDHWLKGRETGILEEPSIRLFERGGRCDWKSPDEWPVQTTRWIPFHLHERGLLFERDHWPNEGYTTFEDSPFRHEGVGFVTPPFVERTEVFGPAKLRLYASTTDTDLLLFVTLSAIDGDDIRELTQGWRRGSYRTVRGSDNPWESTPTYTHRESVEPETVYRFDIELCETGYVLTPDERLCLQIACTDADGVQWVGERAVTIPTEDTEGYVSSGHLSRSTDARVTVHHNAEYPSSLFLPVTSGNVLGTYYSAGTDEGGSYGTLPSGKLSAEKRPPSDDMDG